MSDLRLLTASMKMEKAAQVFAQAVGAMADIEAMKAANRVRERDGYSQAYGEEAFQEISDKWGISPAFLLMTFDEREKVRNSTLAMATEG